ncbi:UDP-N-acetylmuramate dehydrogenase [Halanaerobium saccharolyticum]|uniref:UDP-N-acetylenolpyruvoylglucosamine reductase n=1 Tax=Halanaerobium saccharolyticum TaxID=43595 RepID=A0A4R7YR87_9FIRM|nr:UDP-N-acetylmuramate dehydrogenase [Halanaerobium saccharolyticum]RAK04877.1 UDP-N-acetylmuramate dehydrogenase [Halanaerobium saccharolyticum]TDV98274.1 UDP-N-acetylmuramate dehydrogenase [Halanaerobium saccharolyticum]TDX51121.1 UDP-N-acetylmuramate dehydrogenase [Halanaerobium saccharolyticum]
MKTLSDINSLTNKLKKINYLQVEKNKSLAEFASFKVGGPADLFLTPEKVSALKELMPLIVNSNIPYFILGKGSNLIISDKGYRGIIIYTGSLNHYQVEARQITAECGLELKEIADLAYKNSLGGFEFAAGIPGSLGGALYMNAGAYGGEMKDVIVKAQFINQRGKLIELNKSELKLEYRTSILQKEDPDWAAVNVTIELKRSEKKLIKAKMDELHNKRWSKQPMELPSAGSIFKRPPGHYTGPLIEKAKMKGFQIGGAQVSTKHAGFIVNKGNATAEDIVNLIEKVKAEVYKISGVQLEVEPRFLGEF